MGKWRKKSIKQRQTFFFFFNALIHCPFFLCALTFFCFSTCFFFDPWANEICCLFFFTKYVVMVFFVFFFVSKRNLVPFFSFFLKRAPKAHAKPGFWGKGKNKRETDNGKLREGKF